ncbi:MAG: glycosyltransferase family 2 protein [bacterium]|nr:glycosyltransferase family 2 protein [bacterium]
MRLSVIIPAYNEENRLGKTLSSINDYLSKQNYESEVLVVDNGSKDKTPEIVRNLQGQIKNLRLIEGSSAEGKGFAVKKGMLEATGDFRVFTDADNSTSIDQVERMWPEFEKGFDVVIGSRDVKGAVLNPPQPFLRKVILGDGFKLYRKIIIGLWGLEDTQCGFKGFKKEAALKIFPKSKVSGWTFDVEILILAKKMGYKIKEIPVNWENDPNSKVKFNSVIEMAIGLLKLKLGLFND